MALLCREAGCGALVPRGWLWRSCAARLLCREAGRGMPGHAPYYTATIPCIEYYIALLFVHSIRYEISEAQIFLKKLEKYF